MSDNEPDNTLTGMTWVHKKLTTNNSKASMCEIAMKKLIYHKVHLLKGNPCVNQYLNSESLKN